MLTLNKPPCFYDISSFSRVAVTDAEERTILRGSRDKMVEHEGAEQRWRNFIVHGDAHSEGATLPESRCDNRTGTWCLKFNNYSRTFKVSFLLLGAESETSMCGSTSAIFATLMSKL